MSGKKRTRRRYFIDPKVQGELIARVVFYWVFCLLTFSLMLLCWRVLTGPPRTFFTHLNEMWFLCGPALIGSFILLPLMILDIVRLSNRFAGPILRLRRAMRDLARGKHTEAVHFRKGEYWHDLAEDFNAVLAKVQKEPTPLETKTDEQEEPIGAGAG